MVFIACTNPRESTEDPKFDRRNTMMVTFQCQDVIKTCPDV